MSSVKLGLMTLIRTLDWHRLHMNLDSVLRLPAGQELDNLIATVVLGYTREMSGDYRKEYWSKYKSEGVRQFVFPCDKFCPSSDFADAWSAWSAYKPTDAAIKLTNESPFGWRCELIIRPGCMDQLHAYGSGGTLPLSLCRAMLVLCNAEAKERNPLENCIRPEMIA